MSAFSDLTQNKWITLLEKFGVDRSVLNGKHQPCPFCGGHDRFRFDNKNGSGSWICSSCGAGHGSDLLMGIKQWSFKDMAKEVEKVVTAIDPEKTRPRMSDANKRKLMDQVWRDSRQVKRGDPVSLWLQSRVGNILFPESLRYHDNLYYGGDTPTYHPAMVARVDDPSGRPTTIHRTYLTKDGSKANVRSQRALMAGSFEPGSAIRLFRPIKGRLAIAEGIETALSVVKVFALPAWSLINAGNLQRFVPPEDIDELYIFGDSDSNYAGQAAAYSLAKSLSGRGKPKIHVILPDHQGEDWNDVLKRKMPKWKRDTEVLSMSSPSCDTPTSISSTE